MSICRTHEWASVGRQRGTTVSSIVRSDDDHNISNDDDKIKVPSGNVTDIIVTVRSVQLSDLRQEFQDANLPPPALRQPTLQEWAEEVGTSFRSSANCLRQTQYHWWSSSSLILTFSCNFKVIGVKLVLIVSPPSVSSALPSPQRNVASAVQPLTKTPSWWCTSEQHIERWNSHCYSKPALP